MADQAGAPFPILAQKKAPGLEQAQIKLGEQVSDTARRLRLLEESIEVLRAHLNLIDSSLIEKHKEAIKGIRGLEDSMRDLRAEIDQLKDISVRMIKRMEAFAPVEDVKVLERYVSLWQPLKYVTRSEVEAIVKSILKQK